VILQAWEIAIIDGRAQFPRACRSKTAKCE